MKIYTSEQINDAYKNLPESVREVLFSQLVESKIEKIGISISVLSNGIKILSELTGLAIIKILSKEELAEELVTQLQIGGSVAQKIASDVFIQIIDPLYSKGNNATSTSDNHEQTVNIGSLGTEPKLSPESTVTASPRPPEKMADVAPDNLPTEETVESFLPNLAPKTVAQEPVADDETPLFEQKMKKVFTGTSVSPQDLALDTPFVPVAPAQVPQPPTPQKQNVPPPPRVQTPAPSAGDPYREPIE